MKFAIAAVVLAVFLMIVGIAVRYDWPSEFHNLLGGIFFVDSVTVQDLRENYAVSRGGGDKIKILIVPGHDDEYWGTGFKNIREADLAMKVAEILSDLLGQ